ncbi:hypothetical protein, partial [Bradyrhizobium sp. TM233]|uniref:hypothetical protein n=1 Tax=Bradyrhizobium sp. TM233 TaxID=2599801 RepID=UPI0030C6BD61
DESESEDVDSDGEVQGLMAIVKDKGTELKEAVDSDSESEGDPNSDDENEVFASFSTSELKHALSDIMGKYNSLLSKHKKLKKNFSAASETSVEHEKIISDLKNDNHALINSNSVLKNQIAKLEEIVACDASDCRNESKYEKSFQRFLAKSVDRSLMASMIYGVSRNGMH